MEKTPTPPKLTIIDNRRITPEDVGLDLTIGADRRARLIRHEQLQNEAQVQTTNEIEPHTPLSLETATDLLSYSDTLKGEPAKRARELAEKNPRLAQALVDLTEKHGQDELIENVSSIKREFNRRTDLLGLTQGNRAKSTSWILWEIAKYQNMTSQRKLPHTALRGDALLSNNNAIAIHDAIINNQLGREYEFSRKANKADQLSPEIATKIDQLLQLNKAATPVEKNSHYIAIGELLTEHIDEVEINKQETDPTLSEIEPVAKRNITEDILDPVEPIGKAEASAEKRSKISLKNLGTAALLNFRIARQVGFKQFANESTFQTRHAIQSGITDRYNKVAGAIGDKKDAVKEFFSKESHEARKARLADRYNAFKYGLAEDLLRAQHDLNERLHKAQERKIARKRLADMKVAEMRTQIALRQQTAIREAIRKHALENKHAL